MSLVRGRFRGKREVASVIIPTYGASIAIYENMVSTICNSATCYTAVLCGKSSGWRPVSSPSLVERMTHIHTHAQVKKITGGGVSVTSA